MSKLQFGGRRPPLPCAGSTLTVTITGAVAPWTFGKGGEFCSREFCSNLPSPGADRQKSFVYDHIRSRAQLWWNRGHRESWGPAAGPAPGDPSRNLAQRVCPKKSLASTILEWSTWS